MILKENGTDELRGAAARESVAGRKLSALSTATAIVFAKRGMIQR